MRIAKAIETAVCGVCIEKARVVAKDTKARKTGYFSGGLEYHIYDVNMKRFCNDGDLVKWPNSVVGVEG